MNNLKFRVWDNINLKWHDDSEGYFGDSEWIGINDLIKFINKNRFFIEQFTGLKDKNGKEIYEGDILKNEHPRSPCEVKYGERWIVTGRTSDFENIAQKTIGFYLFRPKDKRMFDFYPDDCEIIGNIHENPELIAVSEELTEKV